MDQDADGGASEAAILVEEEQRLGAAEPVDDAFAVGDDVGLKMRRIVKRNPLFLESVLNSF